MRVNLLAEESPTRALTPNAEFHSALRRLDDTPEYYD